MKNELASPHLPLVHFIAKRFVSRAQYHRIDYDDLFGAGCLGLVKALNWFGSDRGVQFSTYAVYLIAGEIRRLLRDHKPVGVSRSVRELAAKIYRDQVETQIPEEIADRFGCSIKTAERTLQYLECRVLSMNAPLPSVGTQVTWEDALPIEEDYTESFVAEFMRTLSARDQAIVRYRMQGMTQTEIGERVGVGQVSIGRILGKIAAKLSNYQRAV